MQVVGPGNVTDGDSVDLDLSWGPLSTANRYLGAISHNTPSGLYGLTIITFNTP